MKTIKLIPAAAFCVCAMFARADIYVDDDADATSADGTAEHPYATIQAAVDVAPAGTTIRIAEGVYDQGALDWCWAWQDSHRRSSWRRSRRTGFRGGEMRVR